MKYLSAKQIKETYQITSQTLYNWRKSNKITFVRLPSGRIVYELPEGRNQPSKKIAIYGRVSNTKQKDDLIRQMQILRAFVASNGNVIDYEFSDIASGMNDDRTDFNRMLSLCVEEKIKTIYVTYKDRLTRFGFGYIEKFLALHGCEIVVINATTEEDFQQELTQDLVSVIHHFSMKMYSARRKALKEFEKTLISDQETDSAP